MTVPGQGGQVPPRPDQAGIAQAGGMPQGVVVAPGGKPVTKVTQLIVEPGGALQGIFTYSSNPPAAGTLIETASVTTAGTDPYGNNYVVGHASYSTNFAASLSAGLIQFYTGSLAGGWTAAGLIQTDSAGDIFVLASSGRQVVTNNNTLDDGVGNATVVGTLSVNGSTSTGSSGLPDGTIHGTSGAASAGTAHTHSPGSFAVGNGVHVHVL